MQANIFHSECDDENMPYGKTDRSVPDNTLKNQWILMISDK